MLVLLNLTQLTYLTYPNLGGSLAAGEGKDHPMPNVIKLFLSRSPTIKISYKVSMLEISWLVTKSTNYPWVSNKRDATKEILCIILLNGLLGVTNVFGGNLVDGIPDKGSFITLGTGLVQGVPKFSAKLAFEYSSPAHLTGYETRMAADQTRCIDRLKKSKAASAISIFFHLKLKELENFVLSCWPPNIPLSEVICRKVISPWQHSWINF